MIEQEMNGIEREKNLGVIEKEILTLLKLKSEESYNILQISKIIGHGYPATLKYIMILEAKGLINIKDFGNVKIVSIKKELEEV